jgi:hypothetical protein
MKEPISQDSALAGKSIMKSLIVEYPIIRKKGIRKKYFPLVKTRYKKKFAGTENMR